MASRASEAPLFGAGVDVGANVGVGSSHKFDCSPNVTTFWGFLAKVPSRP